VCPFLDKANVNCAAHLTMGNLNHVFAFCADKFDACPVYQKLLADEPNHEQSETPARLLVAS